MDTQPVEWVEELECERREDPAKPLANMTPEADELELKEVTK